jgi:tungstate transport system substrate-binding protein
VLAACGGDDPAPAASARPLILATTTSTQDSGLLDVLVPAFERAEGHRVKTLAVGSGQALELGSRGEADVLLVHSPQAEQELMAKGVAGRRRLVMHNDFVVVGPPDDPARVRGLDARRAFARIADARAPFVSRGDDSGTNTFELGLWDRARRTPRGSWYQRSGQGMGATLRIAAQKRAYTLADRGTLLAGGGHDGLDVLVDGGRGLLNVYHVIDVTRRAGARVNERGGRAFAAWIVSPAAQRLIGAFGRERYGRRLFVPDAGRREAGER